ncbi:MAG: 1-acyl-sn-glycerol-3-phosphate acyltransferase [Deltaproteobacteria bacterium]|nr:1-acyl-sn-glycerol-3-phosphate acyltransferase [Deltaproteobacteria bacterium]
MSRTLRDDEADPFASLSSFERAAYWVGTQLNETHLGKRLAMQWGHHVAQPGLGLTIDNRIRLEGHEHLPRRSMLLASNHRTWFDQFALMIALWEHFPKPPYLYCPVRNAFYYDRPLGVLLNLAVSGNAMYPPVFRDERGPALNRSVVDACVRLLDWSPRTVVALHPEGRRNPSDDPYALLPPKSGIGRIALASRAPVVPSFVNGLPASFGALVRDRLRADAEPVRAFLGAPVPLDDLYPHAGERDAEREASVRVMAAIAALGEQDRAFMKTWSPGSRATR